MRSITAGYRPNDQQQPWRVTHNMPSTIDDDDSRKRRAPPVTAAVITSSVTPARLPTYRHTQNAPSEHRSSSPCVCCLPGLPAPAHRWPARFRPTDIVRRRFLDTTSPHFLSLARARHTAAIRHVIVHTPRPYSAVVQPFNVIHAIIHRHRFIFDVKLPFLSTTRRKNNSQHSYHAISRRLPAYCCPPATRR